MEPQNDLQHAPPVFLVIGTGISGIRAALNLAELGYRVCLVEQDAGIGGILMQLDHQFPNNHCGICRILPMIEKDSVTHTCIRKGVFHKNIRILPHTKVVSLAGSPGKIIASLSVVPTGIDLDKCIGCLDCVDACPVTVSDRFNGGIGAKKAISLSVPYQNPSSLSINWDACTRCNACVDACKANAVTLDNTPESLVLENLAGVIYAGGVGLFDPQLSDVYGIGELPNVVTSTAFERLLSGSGPYGGKPHRLSDESPVQKVAWVQCVGSRNIMIGADYCSSACCMFSIKQALLFKQKIGNQAETTIFYMDMRTYGRDYQRYRDRAEQEAGVRFVRCRVHSLDPVDNPGDIRISYVDATGTLREEIFDMVVLSTGQEPGRRFPEAFSEVGDNEGFFHVDSTQGLKDIAQSIISADDISAKALQLMHQQDARHVDAINIPVDVDGYEVVPAALIVGGGPAGLSAAHVLVSMGIKVRIVEKEGAAGGNLSNFRDPDLIAAVKQKLAFLSDHPLVEMYTDSQVVDSYGMTGRFKTRIRLSSGEEQTLDHGVAILATGGRSSETEAYQLGKHDAVMTHSDLEKHLADPGFDAQYLKSVVMIQCAGSREEPANYCSRICCLKALKNALAVRGRCPEADIYIFYRDMMTYGDFEAVYTEARRQGIMFIPFDVGSKPKVSIDSGNPVVIGYDPVLDSEVTFTPDILSLATGLTPNDTSELASVFGISLTRDGFIQESDSKWRPVDTGREGIFVCGLAKAPANAEEAMQEGAAAAMRSLRILTKPALLPQEMTVKVHHAYCSLCEACIDACPYHARAVDYVLKRISVDPAACQGCGACVAVCPNSATRPADAKNNNILDTIEVML